MTQPDLMVAGAGGGLAGALRAAQHGLSVLVVEASEHFRRGNNTSMSTAMIPGAGTRFQREAGIEDSAADFLADIMAKTHGEADPVLARALAEVSAPLVEWLADEVGLPLAVATDFHYPGHSADRCHTVSSRHGSALLAHLAGRVADDERIDLLVPARLVDVLTDDNRAVRAAVIEYPDGGREEIPTTALLLATNGFGADPGLVAEHLPEIADARYHGSETSRGDALRIGMSLGAATGFLDAYQGHAAISPGAATLVGWATIMHGAVLVNLDGERFGNETSGYSDYAPVLARQRDSTGWIILDKRIHDACQSFTDFRQTVESGVLVWADDVDGLAAATGLPAEALRSELDETAALARSAGADPFGRTDFEAELRPPYAAVRVVPALFHTQGGLVVDEHARVLRADGSAIAGLYASGGAAMGISGHGAAGYLAGNGLLPALGLGYLAADHLHSHPPAARPQPTAAHTDSAPRAGEDEPA
ncbi:MAG: FAD-binding protein [Actinomycetota bacterium]|nr:FAD-binding protein [Actinomycetota bacterium]